MIQLDRSEYYKVHVYLKKVTINNLFARAVAEQKVAGKIYVDDKSQPRTFYIVHPYGMSLLFGNHLNNKFNTEFKKYALNSKQTRRNHEWMQAFPPQWDDVLKELFDINLIPASENTNSRHKNIIELNTRVNFKFDPNKYSERKKQLASNRLRIVQTNKRIFETMKGSVIPSKFWDNSKDFLDKAMGYSLLIDGNPACTAFSAFIFEDMLELGIETIPEFRGKRFAQYTCGRLIDYCLEYGYEPVWACRLENIGSFKLAKKLGFEPTARIPYYRLASC